MDDFCEDFFPHVYWNASVFFFSCTDTLYALQTKTYILCQNDMAAESWRIKPN